MQEQNETNRGNPRERQLSAEEERLLKELPELSQEDHYEMNRLMMTRAEQALEEKYGEAFTAVLIGDRFGKDRAKVFVHPDREEKLVFNALVYFDGSVKDDYPAGLHLFKAENELTERLGAAGIKADANCVFPGIITGEDSTGLSLADFAAKHGISRMLCRLIFPAGTERENVLPVLEEFSRCLPVDLMVNGFMLDEEGFAGCSGDFAVFPSVSEDLIRGYNPAGFFRFFASSGKGTIISE